MKRIERYVLEKLREFGDYEIFNNPKFIKYLCAAIPSIRKDDTEYEISEYFKCFVFKRKDEINNIDDIIGNSEIYSYCFLFIHLPPDISDF